MSGEKDLEQLKREAAEKAKELAKQRLAAKQSGEGTVQKPTPEKTEKNEVNTAAPGEEDADLAKKKAAAAAKAKAAAMAKMKASGQSEESTEAPAEGEDDLAKKKAAAVAKAKAAAAAKLKAKGQEGSDSQAEEEDDLAKKKAAAVAKAKAAAAAKLKAKGQEGSESQAEGDDDLAKKKAAAVAKAKAAAAAKAKAASQGGEASTDDEKAKAVAAAKAKAAAAAKAKAAAGGKADAEEPAEVKKPSPNQPYLDKYVKVITENLGDVLEDVYINPLSKDVPTLVVKKESYHRTMKFLKFNELLGFDYLSELHGTDFQTHMEVYVHLYSYKNRQSVAVKVKLDRNQPVVESVQPLWAGADWPECETYDLLGIKFEGHPNLHRIMLGEDWVGHPLRKDYEPYDVEV